MLNIVSNKEILNILPEGKVTLTEAFLLSSEIFWQFDRLCGLVARLPGC
jgi:hypothetical protein